MRLRACLFLEYFGSVVDTHTGISNMQQEGKTALIHAAKNGFADKVRLLLNAGADQNAKDYVRDGRCFGLVLCLDIEVIPAVFF